MRCTGGPNAPREIIAEKVKIMEAQTQFLKDHEGNITDNLNEDEIGVEDYQFELQRGRVQATEDLTQESVTNA